MEVVEAGDRGHRIRLQLPRLKLLDDRRDGQLHAGDLDVAEHVQVAAKHRCGDLAYDERVVHVIQGVPGRKRTCPDPIAGSSNSVTAASRIRVIWITKSMALVGQSSLISSVSDCDGGRKDKWSAICHILTPRVLPFARRASAGMSHRHPVFSYGVGEEVRFRAASRPSREACSAFRKSSERWANASCDGASGRQTDAATAIVAFAPVKLSNPRIPV